MICFKGPFFFWEGSWKTDYGEALWPYLEARPEFFSSFMELGAWMLDEGQVIFDKFSVRPEY